MKKRFKSLLLAGTSGLMVLGLASCGETRNSSIPYGENDLYNSKNVIATATNDVTNKEMSMTEGQFYSKLRYSGNTIVTNNIKKTVFKAEYNATLDILEHENLNDVSEATKKLLTLTKNNETFFDLSEKTLDYTGTVSNYNYIRNEMIKEISKKLSSSIFSTASAKTIAGYKDSEIEKHYTQFIETEARRGVTVTKAELAYQQPTDDSDVIVFTNLIALIQNHRSLFEENIIHQAELISSRQAIYQIADEEYIHEYDAEETDDKTKNSSYYIFNDKKQESLYNSSYKTYGNYKAVIIQFNSRREALAKVEKINSTLGSLADADTPDKVKAYYLALYNETYAYDPATSLDDPRFTYTVDKNKNDLSDLNDSIKTAITDTLENEEFFSEPRNLSDKYYMVYHMDTTYDVSDTEKETEYEDLTEAQKAKYDVFTKWDALTSAASDYAAKNYKAIIYKNTNDGNKANDLKIYDPVFEYKFYKNYSDVYNLIDKADFNNKLIFSYDGVDYTCEDFYKEAALYYGTDILTDYFSLEYAYSYYDEYIDSDTAKSNEDALTTAISTFTSNGNSTYPAAIGVSNYLLLAYGYETKEDVLKYYYNAQSCLSSYKEKAVFEAWATLNQEKTDSEGKKVYDISEDCKTEGILYNLLQSGNAKYSKLFNINLDHILINIDQNGDGSPDDPDEFLKDLDDTTKNKFTTAVAELAQALYVEATSGLYGDNSYYTILTYLKKAYEEGAQLKTDPTKTWDDYKSFGFLLTVEQLASSGDITETSVNNFVEPFKNYVKAVYKTLDKDSVKIDDDGNFYIYDEATDTGSVLKDAADSAKITIDSLCKTVYGYHLLVVNSYSGPDTTDYKKPSDYETRYENNLPITLVSDDSDTDEDESIVVYTDSWNENKSEISFNQFFIYYVQKANGATSSLESNISSLCSTLFDDSISNYTGSNFQTYLLLTKLNIQIKDDYVKALAYTNNGLDVDYYKNTVTDWGDSEDYIAWVDGTYNWDRPEK